MKHARKRDIRKKLLVSAYAFASAEARTSGADPGFDVLPVASGRVVRLMLTIFSCAAARVFARLSWPFRLFFDAARTAATIRL